ncbi:MAG: methylenetetrahydrofolate reductase [Bifidobacteriaceae bacterium]|nr:methylenetetrahydrofolate reductase [Bifidobacteriaceae bacterium]
MRILDAIRSSKPSVSFEFYPPKDGATFGPLLERAARLEALGPGFVSVTYGAGGGAEGAGRQAASIRATEELAGATSAPRLAHLTLAGHSRPELVEVVGRFLASGVDGFMALRGDPAGGPSAPWRPVPGGLTYAYELVELIRDRTDLPIGVAAFPFGHPSAQSLEHDAVVLARKQSSGADFALSQVLFEAEAYSRLVERAARHGATLPIIPGIMPITGSVRREKLELFAGGPLPEELAERVEQARRAADPDELTRIGVDWCVELVAELLRAGAPGIHFYTLNSSAETEAICRGAGLAPLSAN